MDKSYSNRAQKHPNPTAKKLLQLMDRKQTNLSVAVDITNAQELLKLADLIGPHICLLKTHIDILQDFSKEFIKRLVELSQQHDFMIFEDRKFADIGNTVKYQYGSGIYEIASWSDITNAHTIPGEGIIQGLKEVGLPLGRGLLLLAEMSSKGSLATGEYTKETIRMAMKHDDFCIGFIGQHRYDQFGGQLIANDFILMTPGVGVAKGDQLGQQYRTPEDVIKTGTDVIIVGRGIYGSGDPVENAKEYRKRGWDAYQARLTGKL